MRSRSTARPVGALAVSAIAGDLPNGIQQGYQLGFPVAFLSGCRSSPDCLHFTFNRIQAGRQGLDQRLRHPAGLFDCGKRIAAIGN